MAKQELIQILQQIAQPIVHSLGLEIWGIELNQAGRLLVRIYVETPLQTTNNIALANEKSEDDITANTCQNDNAEEMRKYSATIEQCAKISRMVGLTLEVEEVFSSAYVLEVSTPGFSRPFFSLKQLYGYVGDTIDVTIMDFLENCPPELYGRKKFRGQLVGIGEDDFILRVEDSSYVHNLCFNWDAVRKASRVHVFAMPEKPGKKSKNKK